VARGRFVCHIKGGRRVSGEKPVLRSKGTFFLLPFS
jgi:hypothetical protein